MEAESLRVIGSKKRTCGRIDTIFSTKVRRGWTVDLDDELRISPLRMKCHNMNEPSKRARRASASNSRGSFVSTSFQSRKSGHAWFSISTANGRLFAAYEACSIQTISTRRGAKENAGDFRRDLERFDRSRPGRSETQPAGLACS